MELKQYLEQTTNKVDSLIHQHFGSACDDLARASAHLLLAGGKRLRPALLLLAADAVKQGKLVESNAGSPCTGADPQLYSYS